MNKVLKVPLIIGVCLWLLSFVYGGIYTEMYSEGLGFSLENILLAGLGALLPAVIVFVIALIITYIYHKSKSVK